jgi:hypothetical protein
MVESYWSEKRSITAEFLSENNTLALRPSIARGQFRAKSEGDPLVGVSLFGPLARPALTLAEAPKSGVPRQARRA